MPLPSTSDPRSLRFLVRLACGVFMGSVVAVAGAQVQAPPAEPVPPSESAPAEKGPAKYLRVVEDKDGVLTLELATRTFRRADGTGPVVHLSSAVHIGDKSFYEERQAELDRCDVVLFEGVKASGMLEIDASLDDAAKAEATRKRLAFMATLALSARQRSGAFAKDLAGLAADAGRFRRVVEQLGSDGWGRPLTLSVVEVPETPPSLSPSPEAEAKAERRPARQCARFVSLGSDGKTGGEGHAADIVADSEPVSVEAAARGAEGNIQSKLAKALGVRFQLDEMDSSKPQWRNSDIDVDTLRELLEKAGPNAGMLLRLLEGRSFEARIAGMLISLIGVSQTLSTAVKVVLLDQLANADEMMASVEGLEAMEQVIIEDRNRIVLEDLKRIMEREPNVKTVAIFYGAGHMASMERCMVNQFGLQPEGESWIAAMRVDPRAAGLTKSQVQSMREWMTRSIRQQSKRR